MSVTELPPAADHLNDDQCADLVLGLVAGAEREAALAHVAACPSCEARLRSHVGASERATADWLSRSGSGGAAPPKVIALPRRRRIQQVIPYAAAAALIAAIGLPFLLDRAPRHETGAWLPAAGEEVRTREGAGEDPRLAAGLAAYRARDLATADRELSAAQASGAAEQMRRLYLAHVRLARGDSREALALLRSLDWRSIPEPWRREGEALLARALRQNGEIASADSIEHALKTLDPSVPFLP